MHLPTHTIARILSVMFYALHEKTTPTDVTMEHPANERQPIQSSVLSQDDTHFTCDMNDVHDELSATAQSKESFKGAIGYHTFEFEIGGSETKIRDVQGSRDHTIRNQGNLITILIDNSEEYRFKIY